MGLSEPLSMICDKTFPIPTGEASYANLSGRPRSQWVSTISDVMNFFHFDEGLLTFFPLSSLALFQKLVQRI